ncbi:MAG: hypothetical protein MI723_18160, partial [Caulobacterales bacterium]|nr:hypothetical protein [Caulobacterales bacterium]
MTEPPPVFAISVPIGAYHPLLRDCLTSLAVQSPRPQVALLDASGDRRVAALLDEFADLAAYRRAGPDAGQSDAIIEGWAHLPDADILGWLNADDALYPDALATAAAHFAAHADTDLFYGHSVIIDDDAAVTGYHWAVEPPSARILAAGIISQPSCFFRRAAYERAGGLDRDLHFTMDWDLWARLWRDGARFRFTEAVMSRVLWSRHAKTGGFGAARRAELNRIIADHGDPARRLKSRVGFTLHHLLEHLAPPAVTRTLRRRTAHRSPALFGLDRAGRVCGTAEIPLVHYAEAGRAGLEARVEGAGARLTASAASARAETR